MPQHCDIEDLSLLALGESVDEACLAHLDACRECQDELAGLRQVVLAGRVSGGPALLEQPPPAVWERISHALDEDRSPVEPIPFPQRHEPEAPPPAAGRHLPSWLGLVAAVMVGVLLGGVAVTMFTGQDEPGSIVAAAQLAPMPDGPDRGGEATATLNRTDAGYTVTVKASGVSGPEGFYEVWLLDEQNAGLIALGSLGPGEQQATFPVPDGVDLETFTAVDISDEPLDGDPTHSTVTVLRGTLQV
jgi:hypothetical protein